MRLRGLLALVTSIVPLAFAAHARADGMAPPTGWFAPVGVNVGMAQLAKSSSGAVIGAEASVAHLGDDGYWFGGYADVAYVSNQDATRVSVGPEFGFAFVGVDGGFLELFDHGKNSPGFCIRPMLTLGLITLYARWDHSFSKDDREDNGQIGLLFKFPIPIATDERRHGPVNPARQRELEEEERERLRRAADGGAALQIDDQTAPADAGAD